MEAIDGLRQIKLCWVEVVISFVGEYFLDFSRLAILGALKGLLQLLAHFRILFLQLSYFVVFLLAQKLQISIFTFKLLQILVHVPTTRLTLLLESDDFQM
jgi:hypothetical protein